VGRNECPVTVSLTRLVGNTISGNKTQVPTSYGDVIPQVAMKWNSASTIS
jgi:hypothetical protein